MLANTRKTLLLAFINNYIQIQYRSIINNGPVNINEIDVVRKVILKRLSLLVLSGFCVRLFKILQTWISENSVTFVYLLDEPTVIPTTYEISEQTTFSLFCNTSSNPPGKYIYS